MLTGITFRPAYEGAISYKPENVSSILVSARTGFNVENLITMIFTSWSESKLVMGADIFLVGTTNVGKSSLFNVLLESGAKRGSYARFALLWCPSNAPISLQTSAKFRLLIAWNGP